MLEKDWITKAGLRAAVYAQKAGHRCGYVAVPAGHKYYLQAYDDVNVDVHGGLTYAGGSDGYPVDAGDVWWFGYDCMHLGDRRDVSIMDDDHKKYYDERGWDHLDGTVKTLEYCISECESLAEQLMRDYNE